MILRHLITRALLCLWAVTAPAATVDFSTLLPNGASSGLPITVTPQIKLTRSGTNLVAGIPLTVRPANGPVFLLPGIYTAAISGAGSATLVVPDDAGAYSAAQLATNLVTFLWTNQFPLVSGIVAGSGLGGSTNGGVVTLTNAYALPAGLLTNGQTGVSFDGAGVTNLDWAHLSTAENVFSVRPDGGLAITNTDEGSYWYWDGNGQMVTSGSLNAATVIAAGTFTGDARGLTNFSRAAMNAAGAVTNNQSVVSFGGVSASSFTGGAGGLTNIPAAQLTGVLPMGTLTAQSPVVANGFLTTDGSARTYSRDGGALTNLVQVIAGAFPYALQNSSEQFFGINGSITSASDSYASSPLSGNAYWRRLQTKLAGAFGSGTNLTIRVYTNGVWCGLETVIIGGQTRSNHFGFTTGLIPDTSLGSIGIQSSYNGVHANAYFQWSLEALR